MKNKVHMQDKEEYYPIYEGCGNTFIIFHVKDSEDVFSLKNSPEKLKKLASIGLEKGVDSIMVVSGNPSEYKKQKYHVTMDVFEPHGFLYDTPGSGWSTMCGNGIRGVAEYLFDNFLKQDEFIIETRSGRQTVTKMNDVWKVNMGYFTDEKKDVSKYVFANFPVLGTDLGVNIRENSLENTVDIGFHCLSKNAKDGEPHAIMWSTQFSSMEELIEVTQKVGKVVTSHGIFPKGINTSVAYVKNIDYELQCVHVYSATYERNIFYVTRACGTAATAIGSLLLKKMELSAPWKVYVHMPGGTLTIECGKSGSFFMVGPAHKVAS